MNFVAPFQRQLMSFNGATLMFGKWEIRCSPSAVGTRGKILALRSKSPAPYLASRGMKWIQHHAKPGLSDDDLKSYLASSYRIVRRGLTKKKQKELGVQP